MKSLLISKCLLGENVRYDGGNCSLGDKVIKRLQAKFNLIPICPEVLAGMSIPRIPIELKEGRVITKNQQDVTDKFVSVKSLIKELSRSHKIEMALLKEGSPSCGVSQIYSGDFDGKIIPGSGIITMYCKELGLKVYSEDQIEELFDC